MALCSSRVLAAALLGLRVAVVRPSLPHPYLKQAQLASIVGGFATIPGSMQQHRWGVRLLSQAEATEVDVDLMQTPGFSVDQLMELAGLSVASAVAEAFPVTTHTRVMVVCGPGNNGGDGLVAARHLKHFGYTPVVVYPKHSKKALFQNLLQQLHWLAVPVHTDLDSAGGLRHADAIVDAIFGFSFSGEVRAPFDTILRGLTSRDTPPILSVDIPSGWHVEEGPPTSGGLQPAALISLTAPKRCTRFFDGRHFLGGRFVPPPLLEKYDLQLPSYPGTSQVVELHPADLEAEL